MNARRTGARFIESTISRLLAASHLAARAEQLAARAGALQAVDPRIKVAGLFGLVAAVAVSKSLLAVAGVFAVAIMLAAASRIGLERLAQLVWVPVLIFTGSIAVPAIFLAAHGLRSASFLIARAETAGTLAALLALTTPWPWVMKSLRSLGFPAILVALLGMTFRYIFVILQTASEMFEARKSRTVGRLEPADRRRLAASAVGVLLSKSVHLSGEVHLAMQARGFRGEVYVLHDFRTRLADWVWLAGFAAAAGAAIWWGNGRAGF